MGAPTSALWLEFQHLLLKGLMAARKHMDRIINIVDIMQKSEFDLQTFVICLAKLEVDVILESCIFLCFTSCNHLKLKRFFL